MEATDWIPHDRNFSCGVTGCGNIEFAAYALSSDELQCALNLTICSFEHGSVANLTFYLLSKGRNYRVGESPVTIYLPPVFKGFLRK